MKVIIENQTRRRCLGDLELGQTFAYRNRNPGAVIKTTSILRAGNRITELEGKFVVDFENRVAGDLITFNVSHGLLAEPIQLLRMTSATFEEI